jgi:hypothetical protein
MELSVYQVWGCDGALRRWPCRDRRPASTVAAHQSIRPHQPCDPLASTANALVRQFVVHSRHPVRVAALTVDLGDLREQVAVRQFPIRWRPFAPCPEAAGGNTQHLAEPDDGVVGPLSLHELKPHDGVSPVSLAK